jgi:hypothetical protein
MKSTFNNNSEPFSLQATVERITRHITAAEKTRSPLKTRREHIRAAIMMANELIIVLEKDVPQEKRSSFPKMGVDMAEHDSEMAKYLHDYVPHDAYGMKQDRYKLNAYLTKAKEALDEVGKITPYEEGLAELGIDNGRAFKDWANAGHACLSLSVAESSIVELIYATTKKVPYPANKLG